MLQKTGRGRGVAGMLLALLMAAWAGGTLAQAPPPLPPLVSPASGEQLSGKIIFVRLVTPDLSAAEHFYGILFGWRFHDMALPGVRYAVATLDGHIVAGLAQLPLPSNGRRPAWLNFIATADTDTTTRLAVKQGAKVLVAPRNVPDLGRVAILVDPQGAAFAILQSSSGDPPDVLGDDGAWIWSSLITSNPNADAAFYQSLFGYEVYAAPGAAQDGHLIVASQGYARASVNPLPTQRPGQHPQWLNFVRVADAAASAQQATALGGRVLVPPHPDRDGNVVALIADPQGAVLGLLQWTGAAENGQ